MTNLHSVLKSRDITLLTKIHLVKAMVFPVVMYGCELGHKEGWVPKKWCFQIVVLEKTLESLIAKRSNQSILKEINPEYSLEGLMLKLKFQYFWPPDATSRLIRKDLDAGKDWRQKEKEVAEDEMVGWQHQLNNGHEFEQTLGDSKGQGSLVCCSPWGHKESDVT